MPIESGTHSPSASTGVFRGEPGKTTIGLFPGTPSITIHTAALYPRDDPWKPWLADENTCPGGERITAPAAAQIQTTLCLINYARAKQGLQPVALLARPQPERAAKAADIARCQEFAHAACDKQPDQVARDIGYTGAFGENIYMSTGRYASPRVAIDRWLNSDGHRENLFRPEWRTTGIALLPTLHRPLGQEQHHHPRRRHLGQPIRRLRAATRHQPPNPG